MLLINKFKKWMCRTGSVYKEGKFYVPANTVVFDTLVVSMSIIVGLWFVTTTAMRIIADPWGEGTKLITVLVFIAGAVLITVVAGYVMIILLPKQNFIQYLTKNLEITCERILFPDSVKKIYVEIEQLPEADMNIFIKGLRPLLRKYNKEEGL